MYSTSIPSILNKSTNILDLVVILLINREYEKLIIILEDYSSDDSELEARVDLVRPAKTTDDFADHLYFYKKRLTSSHWDFHPRFADQILYSLLTVYKEPDALREIWVLDTIKLLYPMVSVLLYDALVQRLGTVEKQTLNSRGTQHVAAKLNVDDVPAVFWHEKQINENIPEAELAIY